MSGVKGFISFEGIEGSGKSTQVKRLAEYLRTKGHNVLETAEPGGTRIGGKIRKLLLEPQNHMDPLAELLLYNSSRAQHVREVIYPAIQKKTRPPQRLINPTRPIRKQILKKIHSNE